MTTNCPQCAEVFKIAMDCINGRISDVEALKRLEARAVPADCGGRAALVPGCRWPQCGCPIGCSPPDRYCADCGHCFEPGECVYIEGEKMNRLRCAKCSDANREREKLRAAETPARGHADPLYVGDELDAMAAEINRRDFEREVYKRTDREDSETQPGGG